MGVLLTKMMILSPPLIQHSDTLTGVVGARFGDIILPVLFFVLFVLHLFVVWIVW